MEIIISLLIGIVIGFTTSYFMQKGKNRALKEDIKDITYEKERVTSSFTLDIEKRKYQYESKREQYLKYFNLLDEFNSHGNLAGLKTIMPLINNFLKDYVKSVGNEKKELEIASNFSESINNEMLKSNEKWIKIKNETNSIRLIANEETLYLLNKLENLYTDIFDRSSDIFNALPTMIVLKQQDQLNNLMVELQNLGNEINANKDQLISSMRNDLKEI